MLGASVLFLCLGSVDGSDLSIFGGWTQTGSLKLSEQRFDVGNLALLGVRFEKDFLIVLGFENTLAYSRMGAVETGEEGSPGILYSGNLVLIFRPTISSRFLPWAWEDCTSFKGASRTWAAPS